MVPVCANNDVAEREIKIFNYLNSLDKESAEFKDYNKWVSTKNFIISNVIILSRS